MSSPPSTYSKRLAKLKANRLNRIQNPGSSLSLQDIREKRNQIKERRMAALRSKNQRSGSLPSLQDIREKRKQIRDRRIAALIAKKNKREKERVEQVNTGEKEEEEETNLL